MTALRLIDVIKAAVAQAKLDAHPVGSLYWSREATDPATLFGGAWERVKDRFILAAGDSYAAGSEGGEATHTLTVDEMPAHTHARGTMEIVGTIQGRGHTAGNIKYGGALVGSGGAFALSKQGGTENNAGVAESSTSVKDDLVTFTASRGWTGETSATGGGAAHNNMPPYATYYCWERIE